MHWLLLTLSAFANLAAPDAVSLASPHCHVRAMDSRVAEALAEGLRRSPTFAGLLAAINRSDVMVYIESVHGMPEAISGRMALTTRGNRFRYVRIQVSKRLFPDELISVIGHELQHAVELAQHPDVQSDSELIELYRRIGAGNSTMLRFDTEAAVRIGTQVLREVRQAG